MSSTQVVPPPEPSFGSRGIVSPFTLVNWAVRRGRAPTISHPLRTHKSPAAAEPRRADVLAERVVAVTYEDTRIDPASTPWPRHRERTVLRWST